MRKTMKAGLALISFTFTLVSGGAAVANDATDNSAAALAAETAASRGALMCFLEHLAKKDVRGAVENCTTQNYKQHMIGVAPGRAGVTAFIEEEFARGAKVNTLGIVAEGNMVGIHIRQEFTDGSPPREVIEMWRVENGRLAEHWGMSQTAQ